MSETRRNNSIIVLMIAVLIVCLFAVAPVHAGSVKIGQATNGEGGKLSGCKAGDQSGSEVSISKWGYSSGSGSSYHWVYVFRAKDPEIAKKIAENMKAAAANNHVGYDKKYPDRCSFYDRAKEADWDISAITKNCETTCGSAVSVCLNAAGIKVPRVWYSEIIYKDIMKTGQFECLTDKKYTASDAYLLPGDILCNPKRHTAMVVESPNKFSFDVKYKNTKGKNKVSSVEEDETVQLNLNNGEAVKSVKVEGTVDLKKYTPERNGCRFKGWEKIDDKSYSAQYDYQYSSIDTGNKVKSLDK